VPEDFFNYIGIFNKGDDSHRSLALRTYQWIKDIMERFDAPIDSTNTN